MATTWTTEESLFRLSISDLALTAPVAPAEETRLIKVMLAGKKAAQELAKGHSETIELKRIVDEGNAARRTLIESNGRLVISIANRYQGRGISLAELSQEGVLGLIRAIDKFDDRKGVRLSTYASYWIRQSVSRAVIVQTRVIRLPVHKVDHFSKIRRAISQLTQLLGREPEIDEVAFTVGDEPDKINELFIDMQETMSLEEQVGEDATVADFIEDDTNQDIEDRIDRTALQEKISSILSTLPERARRIIELRYGLCGGKPLTLQDVAKRFGLTRERVRQIEKETMERLQHTKQCYQLSSFA